MFASFQRRWLIVVACTLGLAVSTGTINTFAFAVFIKPVSEDLGVSRSVISSGILLTNVLCGLATPLIGLLLDRWGSRRILLPGVPLFASSIAAFSLLENSLTSMLALFAAAGLFGATQGTVPYTKVITKWFDQERGIALGIALAGIGLGIAIIPQLAQMLIEAAGWRAAYIGVGSFVLLAGFFPVLLFVGEPPPADLPHDPSNAVVRSVPGVSMKEAITQWRFWVMTLGFFIAVVATNGTLAHVVAMLTDRGLPIEQAVATLSMAGVGVILGRIACGSCLDRFAGAPVAVFFFTIPAVGIALLATGAEGSIPLLGGILCGVGLGANNTLMAYFASRYFGLRAYGAIFGMMFGAFLIGTGTGPYLNAISYDLLNSYDTALIASCVGLVFASMLFVPLGPYPFKPAAQPGPMPVTDLAQVAPVRSPTSGPSRRG